MYCLSLWLCFCFSVCIWFWNLDGERKTNKPGWKVSRAASHFPLLASSWHQFIAEIGWSGERTAAWKFSPFYNSDDGWPFAYLFLNFCQQFYGERRRVAVARNTRWPWMKTENVRLCGFASAERRYSPTSPVVLSSTLSFATKDPF